MADEHSSVRHAELQRASEVEEQAYKRPADIEADVDKICLLKRIGLSQGVHLRHGGVGAPERIVEELLDYHYGPHGQCHQGSDFVMFAAPVHGLTVCALAFEYET